MFVFIHTQKGGVRFDTGVCHCVAEMALLYSRIAHITKQRTTRFRLRVAQTKGFRRLDRIRKFDWIKQKIELTGLTNPLAMLYVTFPDCSHNAGDASVNRG